VLTLCVLLWAKDGQAGNLMRYEDTVLELITHHYGGVLVSRVRCQTTPTGPDEVQVIQFPDQAALDSYSADPRRQALAAERDRVVARTEVLVSQLLAPPPPTP
jgi:uncharacterized protein (DUF1330 family)